jgi:cytochrome P450
MTPDWDPLQTDGVSEDWLGRLVELAPTQRVVSTPFGVAFTRFDDVNSLLNNPKLKVPVVEQYEMLGITGRLLERAKRVILGLDGRPHHRLRTLVNRVFTPKAVAGLAPSMQAFLQQRFDTQAGDSIDFLNNIVSGYPAAVIGGMLGVPEDDLPWLETAADAITKAQFSLNADAIDGLAKVAFEVDDYLRALVDAKRSQPVDDLLSRLVQMEVDGDRLDDDEIVSITASVLNAGMDTTRHQSCLAVTVFADHPDAWPVLRAQPELVPNAVEEAVRLRPVTPLLTRMNREPFAHAGVEYPPRTFISLAVAVANVDPQLNPDRPDQFDVRREESRHLSFGFGPHFCLGAALARLELVELFKVMVERLDRVECVGDVPRRPPMGVYGVTELVLAR